MHLCFLHFPYAVVPVLPSLHLQFVTQSMWRLFPCSPDVWSTWIILQWNKIVFLFFKKKTMVIFFKFTCGKNLIKFIELYSLNTIKLNQFKWKVWVLINVYSCVTNTTVIKHFKHFHHHRNFPMLHFQWVPSLLLPLATSELLFPFLEFYINRVILYVDICVSSFHVA